MKRIFFLSFSAFILLVFVGCQSPAKQAAEDSSITEEVVAEIDLSKDYGQKPWAVNIEAATLQNENYRSANWTGNYLQLVFMSLKPGEIIDLEIHDDHDQFIRVEQGEARVSMGIAEDELDFVEVIEDDWVVLVPAGYWHMVENIGEIDLKIYTLYGPPEHLKATVHESYEEAVEAEED